MPNNPLSILIYSIIIFLVITSPILSDETIVIPPSKDIPLYGLDGFVVSVSIAEKLNQYLSEEALSSSIRLQLKSHSVPSYANADAFWEGKNNVNLAYLDCEIGVVDVKYTDGSVTGGVAFAVYFEVNEIISITRFDEKLKILPIPSVYSTIWRRGKFGYISFDSLKVEVKEIVEEYTDILIVKYFDDNSESNKQYIEQLRK